MINEVTDVRIEVRPSSGTNDHEVLLLADGKKLTEFFDPDMMGLDPADLLTNPSPLAANDTDHSTPIGRCRCGDLGCGSVHVVIRHDGARVR